MELFSASLHLSTHQLPSWLVVAEPKLAIFLSIVYALVVLITNPDTGHSVDWFPFLYLSRVWYRLIQAVKILTVRFSENLGICLIQKDGTIKSDKMTGKMIHARLSSKTLGKFISHLALENYQIL